RASRTSAAAKRRRSCPLYFAGLCTERHDGGQPLAPPGARAARNPAQIDPTHAGERCGRPVETTGRLHPRKRTPHSDQPSGEGQCGGVGWFHLAAEGGLIGLTTEAVFIRS